MCVWLADEHIAPCYADQVRRQSGVFDWPFLLFATLLKEASGVTACCSAILDWLSGSPAEEEQATDCIRFPKPWESLITLASGRTSKVQALFCLYLGLRPPDKSQPWPPQAVCRVGGQCLSNLACWAAQVPWLQAAAWASPHLFLLVRPPAPP